MLWAYAEGLQFIRESARARSMSSTWYTRFVEIQRVSGLGVSEAVFIVKADYPSGRFRPTSLG